MGTAQESYEADILIDSFPFVNLINACKCIRKSMKSICHFTLKT